MSAPAPLVDGFARHVSYLRLSVTDRCDLRCGYCDTAYAFHGGVDMDRAAILAEVARHPASFVCLTGGEPMLQRELPDLARDLVARGYEVAVETHGQRPLDALPAEAIRVVDVKTPGSGEVTTDFAYLDRLQPHDEVKFVVCSEADFRWSREVVRRHALEGRVQVLFSPAWGQVAPRDLVRWMLESGLDARLSLQVHKVIWGPDVHAV
jgi:7-carboxy-7-deazaguanine synthase